MGRGEVGSKRICYTSGMSEKDEPLVEIVESDRVALIKNYKYLSPYLRKTVCEMLYRASENLPQGYKLLIITAYRPKRMQRELWWIRFKQILKDQPIKILNPFTFLREVNRYTALPGKSPHQSGAAVDLSVLDKEEKRLEMGTNMNSYGEICHTFTDLISPEQKANRMILYNAMTKAGFVNYRNEWWHYSYGDLEWERQTGNKRIYRNI